MLNDDKRNLPIGGWLYLIGVGVFLSTVLSLSLLYTTFEEYIHFDASNVGDLWTNYNKVFLEFQIIYEISLFFGSLLVQYYFWNRRKEFINVYIAFNVTLLLLTFFMEMLANINEYRIYSSTIGILANCLVWFTYLYKSERVKNTFIKEKKKYIKITKEEYESLKAPLE